MTAKKKAATPKKTKAPKVSADTLAVVEQLRAQARCTSHTGTRDSLRIEALELLVRDLCK